MGYKYYEHKRYYYTFDNSLLFTESIQNTTQIFPSPTATSGFFHSTAGIMQYVYAKPCVHVLIIPGHSRREAPRQGCGHS